MFLVVPGLDRLLTAERALLRGKRVGLICNASTVSSDLRHGADLRTWCSGGGAPVDDDHWPTVQVASIAVLSGASFLPRVRILQYRDPLVPLNPA